MCTNFALALQIYTVSYVKLFVTLVKYLPQIITNRRNRSTQGWAIDQILLDFAGGLLSIAQLGIDSYLQHDWSGITGNPVKLALGNVAMFFDVVFMVQHYCLYQGKREGSSAESEEDPLLSETSSEERI
jgi:cystinosin